MRLFKRENDLRATLVLRFFRKELDNFSGALISTRERLFESCTGFLFLWKCEGDNLREAFIRYVTLFEGSACLTFLWKKRHEI